MSHAITRFDIYILLNKSQTRNCCETNIPLEFKSTLGYFKVGTFQISRPERIALISSLTGDKEKNILGKTASFYGPLDVYSDFNATLPERNIFNLGRHHWCSQCMAFKPLLGLLLKGKKGEM